MGRAPKRTTTGRLSQAQAAQKNRIAHALHRAALPSPQLREQRERDRVAHAERRVTLPCPLSHQSLHCISRQFAIDTLTAEYTAAILEQNSGTPTSECAFCGASMWLSERLTNSTEANP